MLRNYLNEKVRITYTGYNNLAGNCKGVITNIDDEFIEIDNKYIMAIKYIISVEKI